MLTHDVRALVVELAVEIRADVRSKPAMWQQVHGHETLLRSPTIPAPGRNTGEPGSGSPAVTARAPDEAAGDPPSPFETYVIPHVDVLYRVALSLTGQPADAEDLVQDTLIRAYRAIDRFDGAHPRAWLLTILRHTHLNRLRVRRPDLLRDGESIERTMSGAGRAAPSAEDVIVSETFEAVVVDALASLPDKHRSVVTLVDVEGLSYQEAADLLGIPRGTVMSRLHRARVRIRARLAAAGLVVTRRPM